MGLWGTAWGSGWGGAGGGGGGGGGAVFDAADPMTANVLRQPADTFVDEAQANANFGTVAHLSLNGLSGSRRQSFLAFAGLPQIDAFVISATLSVFVKAGGASSWSGGPHTITAKRVTTSWKESHLHWNSAPTVTATHSATAAVTGGTDKQQVDIDVTNLVGDAVALASMFGIRLEVDTNGRKDLYSSEVADPDLAPVLTIVFSLAPTAAVDLVPGGGQQTSLSKPVLAWTYADRDGDAQADLQVQIDNVGGAFTSPLFDSGVVSSSQPQLDLATTAFAGLADGAQRDWRVQVHDTNGVSSGWSDPTTFGRTSKGTLALSSPAATVEQTTPPIAWSLTGRTQDSIEWVLEGASASGAYSEIYRQRRYATTVTTVTIPPDLVRIQNRNYRVTLRVWDTIDRGASPGDPTYSEITQVFQWVPPTSAPASPTGLTAVVDPTGSPGVVLAWARSSTPDYWALLVDGVTVWQRKAGADLNLGGTSYGFTYYGASPGASHTFEIQAVVNTSGVLKTSKANPTATVTPAPVGIWLIDDTALPVVKVQILDRQEADFAIGESGESFAIVGARAPVRIVDSIRGYEGSVKGLIVTQLSHDSFLTIKGTSGRVYRLALGDLNIPVQLKEAHLSPHVNNPQIWAVSFDAEQVGEFFGVTL